MHPLWRLLVGVTPLLVALLVLAFGGCATKPAPSGSDGRACIVGFLDQPHVQVLRQLDPLLNVREGDAIVTQECLMENADDLLNDIFDLTK